MPRNMSFFYTQSQIRDRTKTVTRRLGWTFLRPGEVLNACVKCQGLKAGETVEKICRLKVVSVQQESLQAMEFPSYYGHNRDYGRREVSREGFPDMTPGQFIEMFCKHMKCPSERKVTRIEFEYLDSV